MIAWKRFAGWQTTPYLGHVYKQPCETDAQRAKIRKDYMPEVAEEPEEDE